MPQSTFITSYWLLEEATGTRTDSVGSIDLIENGTVTNQAGINGNEAVFAPGNYLSNSSFATPTGNFSVTGWATLDNNPSSFYAWIGKYSTSGNQRGFYLGYVKSLNRFQAAWSTDGSSTNSLLSNTFGAPTLGVRYFIAFTYDSSTGTGSLSVNAGTQDTLTGTAAPIFDSSADFALGRIFGSSTLWDGAIDEVCFWDGVVLNTGEISTMYNSGSGLFPAGAGGTPFLTLQKAIDATNVIDPKEFDLDIQLADGTYDTMSAIALKRHLAQKRIVIKGNNSDRSLVVIDDSNPAPSFTTIQADIDSPWGFQDLTIGNSSAGAGTHYCISGFNSDIELTNCRLLGTGNTQGISLDNNSLLRIASSLQIEGNFGTLYSLNKGFINAEFASLDFISSPTVTTHIFGVNGSAINFLNISNSGSLTGTRYDIRGCTALRTTNGLDTDIAGSIAGSTAANAVIYN